MTDFTAHDMADNAAKAFMEGAKSAIPEGWQLVPVEPTDAWIKAMVQITGLSYPISAKQLRKVIAAAPKHKESE